MINNPKRKEELKKFLKNIHINYKNISILDKALSHKSYVNEQSLSENNEKLEFLGDSILGFVVTEYLYLNYQDYNEGDLAKVKSVVISENTLSKIAKNIELNKYLLIGKGEEKSGGRNKLTIVADAFEAFLGSYYLDSSLQKVKELIIKYFKPEIELVIEDRHEKDYKTLLQEYSQKYFKICPSYRLKDKQGPEHNRIYFMEVLIGNEVYGLGEGQSKKNAEKIAAKNAYLKITSRNIKSEPKRS